MAANESANISKYKSAFKGTVTKTFSKPSPFKIVTVRAGAMIGEFGYGPKVSHPTPTDPHGGRK
jgi:hypothetical protein